VRRRARFDSRMRADGRQPLPYRITEGLPVIHQLCRRPSGCWAQAIEFLSQTREDRETQQEAA
jgi:hypothetical protein